MTAYSIQELLSRAIEEEAIGILNKPFPVEDLLEILRREQAAPLILVADDDPDFVNSIKEILSENGYSIETARTDQEALDRLLGNAIDVLLLDLRLPILNGLQVYKQLKKHGRSVPTIVITGYAKEEATTIKELQGISARVCMAKPIEPAELLKSIGALLKSKQSHVHPTP